MRVAALERPIDQLVISLIEQLRRRGYDVERVALPFKWYPKEEILPHAAAWRPWRSYAVIRLWRQA